MLKCLQWEMVQFIYVIKAGQQSSFYFPYFNNRALSDKFLRDQYFRYIVSLQQQTRLISTRHRVINSIAVVLQW